MIGEHFRPKTPVSLNKKTQNFAQILTEGVKKSVKKFIWSFSSTGRLIGFHKFPMSIGPNTSAIRTSRDETRLN